jgi:hypothetical protein
MTPTSLARISGPLAVVRQVAGPNPVEYAVLFLVVVAGVLALAR